MIENSRFTEKITCSLVQIVRLYRFKIEDNSLSRIEINSYNELFPWEGTLIEIIISNQLSYHYRC